MDITLNGIFPAMITPFTSTGGVDLPAFKSNIKRWNQYGLHGYLAIGSTGEAPFLSSGERAKLIRAARQTMAEGMVLLAGTGKESTAQTIKACREAADMGADAALVLTPAFFTPLMTAPALERHYRAVADASPIPILLYAMPAFTGVTIPLQTVTALAQHPNIAGMKDSSGNGQYLSTIIRNTPADFAVFTGNAPTFAQALMSQASGAILAIANLIPEICVALYRASAAHNFTEVQHLHNLLQPISEVVGGAYGIGGLKHAMTLLGYKAGLPRPPLLPPTKAQIQEITVALQKAGLLESPR
ncbi:MAG: dihydrodipicolinate synthase family protein [Anaerolineae bacterium]